MVTHETRIREVPGSNPVVEDFSGFLNLKKAKKLVIFQRQMSGWSPYSTIIDTISNVYSFSRSETIVVKMANFYCLSSPNRWQCNLNSYSSS